MFCQYGNVDCSRTRSYCNGTLPPCASKSAAAVSSNIMLKLDNFEEFEHDFISWCRSIPVEQSTKWSINRSFYEYMQQLHCK